MQTITSKLDKDKLYIAGEPTIYSWKCVFITLHLLILQIHFIELSYQQHVYNPRRKALIGFD